MLIIQGITKTYPNGVQALRGVDLTIGRGLFGLLGPNGAGKSTLMRTLATLQAPDAGTVSLDGRPVLDDPQAHPERWATCRRTSGCIPACRRWSCSITSRC